MKKRKVLAVLLASVLSVLPVISSSATDVRQSGEMLEAQEAAGEASAAQEAMEAAEELTEDSGETSSDDKTGEDAGQWTEDDFTYEEVVESESTVIGAKITGFTESGTAKRAENPNLVIPDTVGDGIPVIEIGESSNMQGGLFATADEKFTTVVLPQSLKVIGMNALRQCGLEQISFPNTLKEIGNFAIADNKFKEVILPDSVETVGMMAFAVNYNIERIKISSSMTTIPQGFAMGFVAMENLKEITIPDGIIEIASMAFSNNTFTKIEIPESVKTIGVSAFAQSATNRAMTEVVLHEGLESIGANAFGYILAKKVQIPSTVTTLEQTAFSGCADDGEKVKLYTYNKKHIGSTEGFFSESNDHTTVCTLTEELSNVKDTFKDSDEPDYTKASWSALQSKLEEAEAVDANPEAAAEEVRNAADGLREAVEGMVKKSLSWIIVEKPSGSDSPIKVTADGNLDETVWYLLQKKQEDGSLETIGEDKNEEGTEFTFSLPKNTGKQDITYILTVKDREPAAGGSSGYDWTGAATASIIARAEQGEVETPEGPQTPEDPETPEDPKDPETPEIPEDPGTPEKPEDPKEPETPEDPKEPETPETPENPKEPENPQKPVIKVGSIKLSASSSKIAAGKSIRVTASVSPANANNRKVKWKSSNTKYASVNQSGKVTMKKAGAGKSVTITATAADGSGRKASYRFHIMKDSVRKIVLQSEKSVKAGKKLKITAKVKTTGKKANKKLKWTSSNIKYASVSQKGVVKAKKAGKGKKVKITASSTDGSNKKKVIKIKIK